MAQINRMTMISAIALCDTGAQTHIAHNIRWIVDNGSIFRMFNAQMRFRYFRNYQNLNQICPGSEVNLIILYAYRNQSNHFKYRFWNETTKITVYPMKHLQQRRHNYCLEWLTRILIFIVDY